MKKLFLFLLFLASTSNAQTYIQGGNLIEVPTSTVTSGSTVILTSTSNKIRQYTGSTAQTVVLPVATTLQVGRPFIFVNSSTATLTIQFSDTTTALTVSGGNSAYFSLRSNVSANGTWIISGTQAPLSFTSPLVNTSGTVSCNVASGSQAGCLSSADWTTFNGKQAAGNYITALTGDVTAAGPGSVASTVAKIMGTTVSGTTGSTNVVFSSAPTLSNPVVGTQASSDNSTLAASTAYVQTALAQLNPAAAVYAASTATIAGTYTNAVSGVCIGDTFTTTATTAFALDSVSPPVGSRVLLKNQSSSFQNGVWTLTTQAVGSVSGAVLTRALDFDSSADINSGAIIPVVNGTTNAGSSWYQTATVTTCNTDAQTWTQFQQASSAYLLKSNNLSDVATKATAFNNISPMTTGGDLIYGGASGSGTRLANGTAGQYLKSAGTTVAPAWTSFTAPTVQKFTSGSGNYTTPAGVLYIKLKMVGAGGGGGGSGTAGAGGNSSVGQTGGDTTFGTSTASGGPGGSINGNGAAGGAATLGTGYLGLAAVGQGGGSTSSFSANSSTGGLGGNSIMGGGAGGVGGTNSSAGASASANTGGGGGGAATKGSSSFSGSGGAGGGGIDAIFVPTAGQVIAYSVGAGGVAGTAGTAGSAGGTGGSGIIIVEEYYQ